VINMSGRSPDAGQIGVTGSLWADAGCSRRARPPMQEGLYTLLR
jgi:hypothetical protein